jgi:hypothetical protein
MHEPPWQTSLVQGSLSAGHAVPSLSGWHVDEQQSPST